MQELTLTGGTMVDTNNNNNNNNNNTTNDPVLTATGGGHHNHHQQHNYYNNHNHNHDHSHNNNHHHGSCEHNHGKQIHVRPILTLKKPAIELVEEYNDEQMYNTIQQIVRMGSYELLVELITAWKDNRNKKSNKNNGNNSNNIVNIKLHEYDNSGHTLTHWAAKRTDDVRIVQYFLNDIKFIDDTTFPSPVYRPTKDDTKMTPLHWVCTQDHSLSIIKTLLNNSNNNSNTNTNNTSLIEVRDATGCTPLLIAAQHGHVEIVAYLIQQNANVHAVDNSKDSATHWAAYKGSETVLGLLSFYDTKQLITPDSYGQTPIHLAALRGHVNVVRYIIQTLKSNNNNKHNIRDLKEILYLKDTNGRTPYELAVHKNKTATANVLQDIMDELNKSNNKRYWTNIICTYEKLKKSCTIRTCKVWLGLPEIDDIDESPKFPYYYVCMNILVHIIYHFTIFIPILSIDNGILWDYITLHFIQLLLIIITSYTLYKCHITNPGRLNNNVVSGDNNNNNQHMIAVWRKLYEQTLDAYANDEPPVNIQLCHTCHIARPARSKHDRFMRSCTLQFDHHCPFVGATVGLYNYKWFYGFILSLTIYFINFWFLLIMYYHRIEIVPKFTILLGVVMGLHIFFPMGMCIYHTKLISVNLTTNEHLNTDRYDYLWQGERGPNRRYYNPWDNGIINNFIDRLIHPGDHSYLLPEQNDEQVRQLLQRDSTNNSIELRKSHLLGRDTV